MDADDNVAMDQHMAAASPIGTAERKKMAKTGMAMPDGSFPIPDEQHLRSAIRLTRTPAQRQHVMKRAKALGLSRLIPDGWSAAS